MEASTLQAPAGLGRIAIAAPLLRLRSDDQLLALFRAGSEAAFGTIHDRYRPRLLSYARQMLAGSGPDAEDALQDVFLRAYGALRADDRPVSLRAWLYRVAHNRCIDQLRRPEPAPADVFEAGRAPQHDPFAEVLRREDLRSLVTDVRRLPQQQRSALLMREMEGLSYAELAAALDTTIPAIKSLLVRARIGLVEAVEARDTACVAIRGDLALAVGRGGRTDGRARRHLRDCSGCRDYRLQLRGVQRGFGALMPGGGPLATLAKLFGVGGAGSGAAAGAGAGGSGAAVVAGSASAGVATKVAAVVSAAALTAGGAAEVHHRIAAPPAHAQSQQRAPTAPAPAPVARPVWTTATAPAVPAPAPLAVVGSGAARDPVAGDAADEAISPHVAEPSALPDPGSVTGGAAAPDEPAGGTDGAKPASGLPSGGLAGVGSTPQVPQGGTASGTQGSPAYGPAPRDGSPDSDAPAVGGSGAAPPGSSGSAPEQRR